MDELAAIVVDIQQALYHIAITFISFYVTRPLIVKSLFILGCLFANNRLSPY